MLKAKQITDLQSRTLAQMLADFGTGKDAVFFSEIANISLLPTQPKLEDALRAYCKYRATKQPHLFTKFERLLSEVNTQIAPSERKATADKYAEFVTSVFVAVGQQVNFNVSLYEFLQLFKLTIKH